MNLNQTQLANKKIAFIGCGNMAKAIVGGLVNAGCQASNIIVSNPTNSKLKALESLYAVNTSNDNQTAVKFAEIIVLSVKPQKLTLVCKELAELDLTDKLLISIAAGYPISLLVEHLNQNPSIIRCMPNTPALIGQGATGLFAAEDVSNEQRQIAELIFNAVGITRWINLESQMNIVTAISGSSPAYFFLMMQSMVEQAVAAGLTEQTAYDLILQTSSGAAQLAQANQEESLLSLREAVTSPGGTTAAAIKSLQKADFERIIKQAVAASIDRGVELGKVSN